jgi:archaellum component FlaC
MADNLYQDLKKALQDFKDFLHGNINNIKPAYTALKALVPRVEDLVDGLIDVLGKVKDEIARLDVNAIPHLQDLSTFVTSTTTFLQTAKTLLPDEASAIDDVLAATDVVSGLPSLDAVKADIIQLVDAVVADLTSLKA